MSDKIFVSKEDLPGLVEGLSSRFALWIPDLAGEGKSGIHFAPYRAGRVPLLERQAITPPKRALFPQVERLLSFSTRKSEEDPGRLEVSINDTQAVAPSLVFGARPCDVRGFATFDHVYLEGRYVDPYYEARRANTAFATISCGTMDGACFCTAVGSGPTDRRGSDLWIVPLASGYLMEAVTDRGRGLIQDQGVAAGKGQVEEALEAEKLFAARHASVMDLTRSLQAFRERFSDGRYWEGVASKCINCGICTYLCPTCYCFTISDETRGLEGERLRSWDSCMFQQYTLEASGHNPRPSKVDRYRNRVGHKFSYFPERYSGTISCCGCGRCIRNCPVSLDIRDAVSHLSEKDGSHVPPT
jgi:ferredoxin